MKKDNTEHNTNQDLIQEIQELKSSINLLSGEIGQHFVQLNDNFSIHIKQLSDQIINLHNTQIFTNKLEDTNSVNNNQESLEKYQKYSTIPDEYFIDYSYIDKIQYSSWIVKLKKYNKDMAECRQKRIITTFCKSANHTMESAIEVLFKEEYHYLSESNITFLEAYLRVKNRVVTKGWEFPEICVNKNGKIASEDFKELNDKYISWKGIEEIRRKNFNASVEIFFEILKKNFISTEHFKEKFFLIKNMHQLRTLDAHGSSRNIHSQINELNDYARSLYNSKDNYKKITEVVSWFVKEVYDRINKLNKV